ncbi:DinB family protein [Ornithinimicrobium sp. F0845]|uniref:DinB family protein n=1 Tax=Ornithinimicrobium sp. F0845 TaxID=2926412 RepID=UPI001FF540F9|nr:DinB family protein [Ornithinimicrobium sp. F0845]MCK0114118.1 DinB family protein [Ornithinimicrobium sp. F0845]
MTEEAIEPDTKDWTWTVERVCPECGFDASQVQASELPSVIRGVTAPWGQRLAAADARQRPVPTTWSPLEYACHIHEVLEVFRGRFELILAEDNPSLPNWDQDAAATEGKYAEADLERVAREIPERAEELVHVLAAFATSGPADQGVEPHDGSAEEGSETTTRTGRWERTAVRSDGASFTALTLGRYLVHDLAHHLYDVGLDARP